MQRTPETRENLRRRILNHVRPLTTGCWLWTGAKVGNHRRQYGVVSIEGRYHNVRRVVYGLYHRTPLEDRAVDSTCGCELCVNPKHLVKSYRNKGGRKKV